VLGLGELLLLLKQIAHVLNKVFVGLLVHHEGELVDEISKLLLHHNIEVAVVVHPCEVAVLFSKEAQALSLALVHVVHPNQDPLLLDLLDCDNHVMVVSDLHALSMDDVLIICLFIIDAELKLL